MFEIHPALAIEVEKDLFDILYEMSLIVGQETKSIKSPHIQFTAANDLMKAIEYSLDHCSSKTDLFRGICMKVHKDKFWDYSECDDMLSWVQQFYYRIKSLDSEAPEELAIVLVEK